MSEANEILRSYVRLLGRLSGAASVSLYVPPGVGGEREMLIHEGALDPLPELADVGEAAQFHRGFVADHAADDNAVRLTSRTADGVLYRVPLSWMVLRSDGDAAGPDRRKADARPRPDPGAWIGLRFDRPPADSGHDESAGFPRAADALSDERWWKGFLGLAAAFAAHARTVSRSLLDPVTGVPDRGEFQAELETALAHAAEASSPTVLLLLGPDDFGWVNERLDRRAGDHVLQEVADGLRGSLRSHDHVARYGGAILTVILRDTAIEDGRVVAENILRRLGDHRYHEGTLRLEFSAGVAGTEKGDPIDGQELIRRADQALVAAKRGDAGNVRVWKKGSDVEDAGSLDRLQGIFTGDKSKDYRNMGLLLDSVGVVAASTDPGELARSFTERLFKALHARRVGVLERLAAGRFELLGGLERSEGGSTGLRVTAQDTAVLERACSERNFVVVIGEGPGELSLCALPLFLEDRCLGGILLEVTPLNVSFEGSDRRFLDALSSQLAVALDRARLTERERQRQRAETEALEAEVTDLRRVVHGSRLAYRSAAMEAVLATARRAARTDTTVLITGESGTGKEILAHTLHELSPRHERPFVVVDCSAISPTLIESELFGHERGAFTGAVARKPGRLAQAHGATVFLDEIGDLPLDLQSKLLRFVQDKQFTPVGSVAARTVDARIIAATNVDLRAEVANGKFREDLFHRLNVVRLHVPPLRDRRDDILHLATIFLRQFAALYRRPAHHFTAAAEQVLETYAWPGNVRELQNLVLTSVLFCDAPEVDVDDLQAFQASAKDSPPGSARTPERSVPPSLAPPVELEPAVPSEPAVLLRRALAREIAMALQAGGGALAPIGKWLTEDLIDTADRLAGGVLRRGADLLGLPETTYRRRLQGAVGRRATEVVRSPGWPHVASLLEELIKARRDETDVCQWAEACLLVEIESAVPNDARVAAALLGVTVPTLLRRKSELVRHF